LDRRRFRDEEINAEELAAQLRERYSRDDYASGGRRGNIEHVTERMKLPDVKGPKLWMIKCKVRIRYYYYYYYIDNCY
jgi:transcription elongation factor SPT5